MALVVGIFDAQTMPVDLDTVMRALAQYELKGNDVTVLNATRTIGSPAAPDNVVLPVIPLTAASANSGDVAHQNAGAALIATGVFDRLDIRDEERDYFKRQADKEGATVVFVKADHDLAEKIVHLFNRSNASRAEILR
jgi:hypothetical protein